MGELLRDKVYYRETGFFVKIFYEKFGKGGCEVSPRGAREGKGPGLLIKRYLDY